MAARHYRLCQGRRRQCIRRWQHWKLLLCLMFDDDEHGLDNAGKHAEAFLLWAWGVKYGKVSES
eukprot:5367618-Ditylum_brightwellii.AAC.1